MKRPLVVAVLLAASAARAGELPRLAGTVISPGQRVALFHVGKGGAVAVGIGENIGDYVVREIGPGRVQLDHSDQHFTVSIAGAAAPSRPVDTGGVTFGMVLHHQGPADD